MLDMHILNFGKTKIKKIRYLWVDYLKRLSPYARVKEFELTAEKLIDKDKEKTKIKEEGRLLDFFSKRTNSKIILLAEEGKELDSLGFANFLSESNQSFVFVIAGALGWSDNFKKDFQKISLSRLTFPHELAKLILFEQIYRAATIKQGKQYHY